MRRRLLGHPFGYAGDGAVQLRNDNQFGAPISVAPQNQHRLSAARMEWIVNLRFNGLLAGSMSLFRERPGSNECPYPDPRDA